MIKVVFGLKLGISVLCVFVSGCWCVRWLVWEFKRPEEDDVIDEFSRKKFADNFNKKIKWVVNLFVDWYKNRMDNFCKDVEVVRCNLDQLNQFSKSDMCFAMSHFIREIKRMDGKDYPPNTLHEIVIMIQMYLYKNGVFWCLLDNPEFVVLRNVLDNTMKERQSSDIISLSHESNMFRRGFWGRKHQNSSLI